MISVASPGASLSDPSSELSWFSPTWRYGQPYRQQQQCDNYFVRITVYTNSSTVLYVVGSALGGRAHDDFHTGEGCVVLPRSFLAVHVSKAVGVLLDEVVVAHHLGEEAFPEQLRLLQVESSAFKE
jgi:hypothetical protein